MTKLQSAELKIKKAEAALEKALTKKNAALKDATAKCRFCGKRSKLSSIDLIQTHYYIPPSGCSDGAYWTPSELNWMCPKCKARCRDQDFCSPLPEDSEWEHFKSKRDCYCDYYDRYCKQCRDAGAKREVY